MKSKTVSILVSFLVAICLWAYVVTVVDPEAEATYYNVPVVLDGQSILEDRDLMIVSDKNVKVDLTLSGYRTDLNKLDNTNITLLADLSQITAPGTHTLNYSVSYPGSVQSGNIHTVKKAPQQITLTVVERSEKEVPVQVQCLNEASVGFRADKQNILLDHSTVTVSGPKEVIDRITQARVVVDLADRKQTVSESFRFTLCDSRGQAVEELDHVSTNVKDVHVTVKIQPIKYLPVEVNIIPGGGLTDKDVTVELLGAYFEKNDYITVSGREDALNALKQIQLTIDLSKEMESRIIEFPVALPSGVENVSGITTIRVQLTILESMPIRSFQVTEFIANNVPEGYEVRFQTLQMSVIVRGPKEILDQLTEGKIRVSVDFTDAKVGSSIYKALIQIELEGVGAVGEYTVSAELVEAQTLPED